MGVVLVLVPPRPGGSMKVEAVGLELQTAAVVAVAVAVAATAGPLVGFAGIDRVVVAVEGTSGGAVAVVAEPMAR